MGSLRNPVGPLPSSIYWRRRAVLLSLFALLALLITWIVVSGGGDGGNGRKDGADGKNPAPSITPGPSGSGPAISQAPGGRDESGSGDSNGSGSGASSGSGDGSGAGSGSGGGESGGDDGSGGSGGASGGGAVTGVGAGDALPAGSALPNCTPGAVKLSLRSVRNSYSPGQTPAFELTARNTSGSDCKVDLGPEHAVFTITPASGDDAYWSSDDCVEGEGSLRYRVAAGSGITYTVKWDRKPSAPECGTPPAGSAKAGTYLVEAKAAGFEKVRTSFVLKND
ncbi:MULTISPECIES: hypothetical protein [unclassified Streptomyces]|uniref:hypothetical protein n=1 Tax=unclassified Streptomyces TaxID=2593676 RepID=UPI001F44BF75|nr:MULTISPECIES: hypothetical protein [unclassified Streptomyces]WKX19572.1 hypothetical protein Q3Y68_16575 [Streptomyces sp. HUAS CX7]